MAITDISPADIQKTPRVRIERPVPGVPPLQALARLSEMHAETFATLQLDGFLRSAARACALLLLMGLLAVAVAGGASLKQEFAWGLMVLAGIGAMLRTYIKSTAQALDRAPLRASARTLRILLLYMGFAWGCGAFLLLGDDPLPVMGLFFAILPSACLLPLLRDRTASLAFMAPVTALTAAAMLTERWGGMPACLALLLMAQGGIAAGLMLGRREQPSLPAGLSLP